MFGFFHPKNPKNTTTSSVTLLTLPDIPEKIDFEDLGAPETGRLYNEEESKKIINALKGQVTPRRYSKKDIGKLLQLKEGQKAPFGIFHDADGKIYAIYKGSKHHKELGQGAFGKAKCAQNIEEPYEWVTFKVQEVKKNKANIDITTGEAQDEKTNINRITDNQHSKSTIVNRLSETTGVEKIAFVMPYAGESNLEQFCFQKKRHAHCCYSAEDRPSTGS